MGRVTINKFCIVLYNLKSAFTHMCSQQVERQKTDII